MQGQPNNARVGGLSLCQQIFLTQELNQGLLHWRQILYQLSYEGSPKMGLKYESSRIPSNAVVQGRHRFQRESHLRSPKGSCWFGPWTPIAFLILVQHGDEIGNILEYAWLWRNQDISYLIFAQWFLEEKYCFMWWMYNFNCCWNYCQYPQTPTVKCRYDISQEDFLDLWVWLNKE